MSTVRLTPIGSIASVAEPLDDGDDDGGGAAAMSDREAEVYRYATRCGEIASLELAAEQLRLPVPEVFAAVTRLVELHLLCTAGTGDRLVPIDRGTAEALLISPIERAMYQRRELTDRLRDRIDAIPRPAAGAAEAAGAGGAAEPAGAIDGLDGVAEIRGLLKLASDTCRHELILLRPSHDEEDLLDELLEPCQSVLERDVPVRILCPHRSRAGFASRARATRQIEDGAQVRTLSQVPQGAVVFDHTLALVLRLGGPAERPTARRVRDQNVVRFLVHLFDQMWEGASPYSPAEPGYAGVVDDLHQSIARLMAQGYTDEVVARRLGMSVRTCRRHIAALLDNLGSVSRFQAGVHAASHFTINTAQREPTGRRAS